MDDILLLDTTERYFRGELNAEQTASFEALRKSTPEIDQMVVEHNMFLHQIEAFGENRDYKHKLHEIHFDLEQAGEITDGEVSSGGKVLQIWNRYKKVTAIAATIASITALFISALVTYINPRNKGEIVQ